MTEQERLERNRLYRQKYHEKNKDKINERKRAYYAANKEKMDVGHKRWRDENVEQRRKTATRLRLQKQYGLSVDEFEAMVAAQGSCCAICRDKLDLGSRTHVDHCHETGAVRKVLCAHCNHMLGHARDNVGILLAAVDYLQEHKKNNNEAGTNKAASPR